MRLRPIKTRSRRGGKLKKKRRRLRKVSELVPQTGLATLIRRALDTESEPVKKAFTPEEEERRKAEFIRVGRQIRRSQRRARKLMTCFALQQYGQVEEGEEEDEAIPDKALIDPSKLSKKQRKKAFDGVGKSLVLPLRSP